MAITDVVESMWRVCGRWREHERRYWKHGVEPRAAYLVTYADGVEQYVCKNHAYDELETIVSRTRLRKI